MDHARLLAESNENLAQLEELILEAKAMRAAARQQVQVPIVHVVDDNNSFRTAIIRLLAAAGYEARGYQSAGAFLLAKIEPGPGCILLDARMPGPSGLDLQQELVSRPGALPIVFISGHCDVAAAVRAIKAGALDFLTKPVRQEMLLSAVRNALSRYREDQSFRERLAKWRACYRSLSQRELKVFEGVVCGKMNKEIAAELGAAERTIKAHRAQVMQKMQVHSLAELVHVAEQLKVASPT